MEETTPVRKRPTLLERALWKVFLKSFNVVMALFIYYNTKLKKRPALERPTYVKRYSVRPTLDNHVWIPKSYKPGTSALLPLLIDIHGGGFCIGHPFVDDKDNAIFCHKHGICVVSINYRKAPEHGFPTPVEDVAALIEAVLDDTELPVDKSKVALIGYSAGGNLSLTGPQLNGLHEKIKASVAFYPVTDFYRTLSMRIAASTPPPNRDDMLIKGSRAFNWFYLRHCQDYKNPLLSPLFADRKTLPQKLFILGCEYDILFSEARDAAEKYAEQEVDGPRKVPLEQGRTGWTCGYVTWEELKGLEHGYNQRWSLQKVEIGAEWKRRTEEIHDRVAEWLFQEVYGST
jgi:acetyl esterase/lipase